MRADERGTILIEFIGSFLLFVLLIASILTLVNIVTLQARVHYALTQTANTLSMYGYALEVTGVAPHLKKLSTGHDEVTTGANAAIGDVNMVLDGINGLDIGAIQSGAESLTNRIEDWAGSIADDPMGALQKLLQYAGGEGTSFAFGELLKPLMNYYLENGDMSGADYLESVRVIDGLQFYDFTLPQYNPASGGQFVGSVSTIDPNDSALIDANDNIKLTVRYEIEYSFFGLKIPFSEPKLKVTQSATTKMWLSGSGEGYKR
ncbi:MAG: hypothetical protein LBD92_04845 [Oscillospiraceae bacterium]|jgi:hypothetical protein|nr:hypothetical protein [Oscillospiraceae bacterium]